MTCPVYHEIPVDAFLPLIKRRIDFTNTNLQLKDVYVEEFKNLAIERAEMPIVFPRMTVVDVVVGTERLKYIGEP